MHITEFLKTNNELSVHIKKGAGQVEVTIEIDGEFTSAMIPVEGLKPGDVESTWFKLLDKFVKDANS